MGRIISIKLNYLESLPRSQGDSVTKYIVRSVTEVISVG